MRLKQLLRRTAERWADKEFAPIRSKLFSHGHCAPTAHTDNSVVTWDTAVEVTTSEAKSRDPGFESRPQAVCSDHILVVLDLH
jgi:hypothetical protein